MSEINKLKLEKHALEVRKAVVRAIGDFGMGHIGGSLSLADIIALLYFEVMHVDPKDPKKKGRDRLVLSKGHAGPVLYAALALRGFFSIEELKTLNRPGTNLPSHCDMLRTTGIDMTAGSLGQGFSCAVGIAKAAKLTGGRETIYAIIGDGESQEGQIWEAAMAAAHFRLDNLIVFLDYNRLQLDGSVEDVMSIGNPVKKWEAFGFRTCAVNGHDMQGMYHAIQKAKTEAGGSPAMIVLETVKGKGVSFVEQMGFANHHCSFDHDMQLRALIELDGEEDE
jgi:transketolase